MIAEPNKTYAQIIGGKVHWIFTHNELPEWNEENIQTIDVTGAIPQVGMSYVGGVFLPIEVFPPTKAQRVAAVLTALPRPMTREQVQTAIIACESYAKANGWLLTYIYTKTKLYQICKDAEAACVAEEAKP